MQKIPTLFKRDPENMRFVTDEINPGCEWVFTNEAVATRKYDGTCVMFDGERWWARREVKVGKQAPEGFVLVEHDPITDKKVGWEPIRQSSFFKFWEEAVAVGSLDYAGSAPFGGTYELCGPKINGNPEDFDVHELIRHETAQQVGALSGNVLRVVHGVGIDTFAEHVKICVAGVLGNKGWEGVVWHHPDGRMAKLKARDIPPKD